MGWPQALALLGLFTLAGWLLYVLFQNEHCDGCICHRPTPDELRRLAVRFEQAGANERAWGAYYAAQVAGGRPVADVPTRGGARRAP